MLAIKSERLSCDGEGYSFHDCFAADREQAHSYRRSAPDSAESATR